MVFDRGDFNACFSGNFRCHGLIPGRMADNQCAAFFNHIPQSRFYISITECFSKLDFKPVFFRNDFEPHFALFVPAFIRTGLRQG